MMKKKFPPVFVCSVMIALTAARVLPSRACATANSNPEASVVVTNESAITVWDAKHRRQHFIRGATFKSDARDIGFLVPSPSTPELQAADHAAFDVLKTALEPKVEHRTKYDIRWALLAGEAGSDDEATATTANAAASPKSADGYEGKTAVQVLQTKTVAGYDATTLKADDASALNKWLKKNGYIAKADFKDWLAPYVRRGWVITAFKIRKTDKNIKQFSSALVRMSFKTDKPFFPYREPASQREGVAKKTPRSLRVFFISDQRVAGAMGVMEKTEWPGKTKWSDDLANHLDAAQRANLLKDLALKPEQLPSTWRMTSFEDFSSPRPGFDDVYFSPAMQQETITPPPIVIWQTREIWIPLDMIFVVLVLGIFVWLVARGLKNQSAMR